MKHRQDYYRSNYDQAFFAQTILGLDLYPYQIEVLRTTQTKLNPSDMTDVIGMLPASSGLTTIIAIAAAHNMVFGTDNMRVYVSGTDTDVVDLRAKTLEFIKKAEEYFDTTVELVEDTETKSVNKTNAANLYFTASKNVFRDLPLTDMFIDSAVARGFENPWFTDALESLKPQQGRVFALSTSFNPMIQIIRNTLKRRLKRQVHEINVDARTIWGPTAYEEKLKSMGIESFVNDVLCASVNDPNNIARFHRGEF